MSLYGALQTAVSALSAQSNKLSMISDNIANSSTTGYKSVNAGFSTLVTSGGGSAGAYSSGGVTSVTRNSIDSQGTLEQTSNNTALAVSGNGFFVVRDQPNNASPVSYTRAGDFTTDNEGYLRNTAGKVLYGWKLDTLGAIPSANSNVDTLKPVNVSFLGGQTKPTTTATVSLNLKSTQAIDGAANFTRSITVYDSLGTAQEIKLNFSKTGTATSNTWSLGVQSGAGTELLPSVGSPATNTIPITFNTDGSVNLVNGVAATTKLTVNGSGGAGISWGNGSSAQTIKLDLSSITQYNSDYNVVSINQDGAALGLKTGVSIDDKGIVSATFSNGTSAKLYQLPIATFSNVNGLKAQSGNSYTETSESGNYNLRTSDTAGAGKIASGALESSNVDLASEFSKMIITQNAYAGAGKVISTANQMLQTLLQTIG